MTSRRRWLSVEGVGRKRSPGCVGGKLGDRERSGHQGGPQRVSGTAKKRVPKTTPRPRSASRLLPTNTRQSSGNVCPPQSLGLTWKLHLSSVPAGRAAYKAER